MEKRYPLKLITENLRRAEKLINEEGKLTEILEILDALAIVNALILKTKLALLEANIKDAVKLLTRAELIAREKGLILIHEKVKKEQNDLDKQLDEWKGLYERNASMYERLERSRINNYFKDAQKVIKMMDPE